MSDLIDRRMAIGVLNGCTESKGRIKFDDAVKGIKKLPPAQPAPCEDAVSRKAVAGIYTALWETIGTIMDRDEWDDVCKATANELPPAQPRREERKIGEWIYDWGDWDFETCKCSECGNHTTTPIGERYSFCPNCGADMREVTE